MKTRHLGKTGLQVPVLGFGTSPLGSMFSEVDEQDGIRTVHEVLDLSINFIDTAPLYGPLKAEIILGKALKDVPRDSYLLSTKAGRYKWTEYDFTSEGIVLSLEESLQRLNTDYVDIFQLHDIEYTSLEEVAEICIPTLQRLKQQGKFVFTGLQVFR
nr:aldo/keto reductase [Paenibacillus alginolyticus]